MKIKICRVCGLVAPADAFPKGRRRVCKTCYQEQAKEYRKKLKAKRGNTYASDASAERRRAYQRKYYSEHKNDESFKMKRREWRKKRYQLTKH